MEKNRFKDLAAAERAIFLLEYIVTERAIAPEFQLSLNKFLCGMTSARPIRTGLVLTTQEIDLADKLIHGIITNWKVLKNTSAQGLRSAFLQREGYLAPSADGWRLHVIGRAYDLLLQKLPWPISIIKHPWMSQVLYVDWTSP